MKYMFVAYLYMMLKFGQVGKQIGSTLNVPKGDAGENKDDIWADRVTNEVLHLIKKEFSMLNIIKRKNVIVLVIYCVVTAF